MKNNSKQMCLRLSANELKELVKQEREKWRIFRIQQVREQAREEAHRVREAVRAKEGKMIKQLEREVEQQWQEEKEKKVIQLEKEYQDCVRNIGQAHRLAREQPDADKVLQQRAQHNRQLAVLRGRDAGKQQWEEVRLQQHRQNTHLKQRQDALRLEKLRASHVASLPVPKAFRKKTVVKEKPPPRVALHEAGTFTTTHYVPQSIRVEKEVWSSKPNAKEKAATEEADRVRQEEERRRQAEEEHLKREQRGREALKKEHLARLLQHLTAGLDEAQHKHHLSHFLSGKDGMVWETEESRLKERTSQQRKMEEAADKLLQQEEEETEEEEYPIPDSWQQSSDYLEEIESLEGSGQQTATGIEVRGLESLLKEVERRRRRILQELDVSIPTRERTGDDKGEGSSFRDTGKDIHLADTIPVHLHPGHPPIKSSHEGSAPGQPSPPLLHPEQSTNETPDSSSTVLPLSEESISISTDSIQHSILPSLPHRYSTPTEARRTRARQPIPIEPHTTTSCTASSSSDNIKINIDLDVGSSSLVSIPTEASRTHASQPTPIEPLTTPPSTASSSSDNIKINIDLDVGSSTLVSCDSIPEQNQHQKQQTEFYTSSTEYYSPPSELPRKQVSLQEIEDNLRRIQENRRRNQNHLDLLSWKRGSPGSHIPTTIYLENLKEEGSGRKPITRKDKYEHQKKELIQFYIRRLLQRGNQEGDLSASTVEGSGMSISSLGSFLGYLEGEREKDQPTTSDVATSSSTTSRSLSAYKDIDEFPVRMKSRESGHLPTHAIISSSSTPSPPLQQPHLSSSSSPSPSHFPSPSPFSSSFTTHPHIISEPHPHPMYSPISLEQEQSGGDPVCTSYGASTNGSPELISSEDTWSHRHSSPHICLTPPCEDESAMGDSEAASELPTTTRQGKQAKSYGVLKQTQPGSQYQPDITTSSDDTPREATSKLAKLPRNKLSKTTETIPSVITQSSEDIQGRTSSKLSEFSETRMNDISSTETSETSKLSKMSSFRSLEGGKSVSIPLTTTVTTTMASTTTTTTTSQPVSHSSGESTNSMPDMAEVLRRFGLDRTTSESSTTSIEEKKVVV